MLKFKVPMQFNRMSSQPLLATCFGFDLCHKFLFVTGQTYTNAFMVIIHLTAGMKKMRFCETFKA